MQKKSYFFSTEWKRQAIYQWSFESMTLNRWTSPGSASLWRPRTVSHFICRSICAASRLPINSYFRIVSRLQYSSWSCARNKRESLWGLFWGTHEGLSSVDRLVPLRSNCQPRQRLKAASPSLCYLLWSLLRYPRQKANVFFLQNFLSIVTRLLSIGSLMVNSSPFTLDALF